MSSMHWQSSLRIPCKVDRLKRLYSDRYNFFLTASLIVAVHCASDLYVSREVFHGNAAERLIE